MGPFKDHFMNDMKLENENASLTLSRRALDNVSVHRFSKKGIDLFDLGADRDLLLLLSMCRSTKPRPDPPRPKRARNDGHPLVSPLSWLHGRPCKPAGCSLTREAPKSMYGSFGDRSQPARVS